MNVSGIIMYDYATYVFIYRYVLFLFEYFHIFVSWIICDPNPSALLLFY